MADDTNLSIPLVKRSRCVVLRRYIFGVISHLAFCNSRHKEIAFSIHESLPRISKIPIASNRDLTSLHYFSFFSKYSHFEVLYYC